MRSTTPRPAAATGRPLRPTVLICAPALDAVSGVSTHVRQLFASELGRSFCLCHFRVGSEGRSESGFARLKRLVADPWRMLLTTRRSGAALVHINTSMNPRAFWRDALFVLVARLCRTPVLYQLHGGKLPCEFCRNSRLLTTLLAAFLSLPERIVLLGHHEFEAYRELVPAERLAVIPNAINTRSYDGARPPPGHRLELLYLGRLDAGKGVDDLLHGLAAPELADGRPGLTVVGSGPHECRLRTLAASLGVAANVRFVGTLSGAVKRAALRNADALVLPSHQEGLPYVLLEAMAAGNAVITTPVGAIPDVVTDGVHGLIVEPRDRAAIGRAILTLRDNRQLLERLSAASRAHARAHYDVARLERELADTYRALINTGCKGSLGRPMNSPRG